MRSFLACKLHAVVCSTTPCFVLTTTANRSYGLAIGIASAIYAAIFVPLIVMFFMGLLTLPMEPEALENQAEDDSLTVLIEPEVEPVPIAPLVQKPKAPAIRYLRTNSSDPSDQPPEAGSASFISDRNTKAASESAPDPNGDPNLPSQKGMDSPVLDLADREFAKGDYKTAERVQTGKTENSAPAPPPPAAPETPQNLMAIVKEAEKKAAEKSRPSAPEKELDPLLDPNSDIAAIKPEDTPKEPVMKEPKFEKLFPDPPKAQVAKDDTPPATSPRNQAKEGGTPGAPKGSDAEAHQTQTRKNLIKGAISTKGPKSSVDAADTPMGRFMAKVGAAVSAKFTPACMRARDRITYGTVQVEFDINRKGQPENLRIANEGSSNAVLQDIVLGVVLESKLPPIPDELNEYLIGNRLHVSYGFLFH